LAPHNKRLAFGGVPERSKGSDCKSDGSAFGGSNPPPSTSRAGERHRRPARDGLRFAPARCGGWIAGLCVALRSGDRTTGSSVCGCSSMVELQPSKLITWVRFPSPAPNIRRKGGLACWQAGHRRRRTRAVSCELFRHAHIAQSAEHFLGKEEVTGSSPVMGSRKEMSGQARPDVGRETNGAV
jgi:hypothetical protein